MDRLTIIPSDGAIYVDLVALDEFDLSFIPSDVHALQWLTDSGWIEHIDGENIKITELPDWATQCLLLWQEKWAELNAPKEPPPLTINDFVYGMQIHFESVAREKDYDGVLSIVSYAQSTSLKWQSEAEAFIAWRDECWAYGYQELDKYERGERTIGSVAQFVAELPVIVWPNE